jgi:hypothetical protein
VAGGRGSVRLMAGRGSRRVCGRWAPAWRGAARHEGASARPRAVAAGAAARPSHGLPKRGPPGKAWFQPRGKATRCTLMTSRGLTTTAATTAAPAAARHRLLSVSCSSSSVGIAPAPDCGVPLGHCATGALLRRLGRRRGGGDAEEQRAARARSAAWACVHRVPSAARRAPGRKLPCPLT